MPLEQRRKLLSLRCALKIISTPNNLAYNNTFADRLTNQHNKNSRLPAPFCIRLKGYLNTREITSTPIIERNYGKIAPWSLKTPKTNTNLANHKKNEKSNIGHKQDFQKLNTTYKNYHKIYTDASKTKHGNEFVIVTENTTKKQRLSNHTSILTAETYVILEALRYIQKNKYQSAVIYTDSLTSINAITNTNTTKSTKSYKWFRKHTPNFPTTINK